MISPGLLSALSLAVTAAQSADLIATCAAIGTASGTVLGVIARSSDSLERLGDNALRFGALGGILGTCVAVVLITGDVIWEAIASAAR